ncbi:MAG: CvpA family protein [Saprospirales bacterium]|nr:CvpA family protein [Saprospirales bacterium]
MVIDIIFLLAAIYGFYLGFTKGIIRTVFNVLSIFLGVLGAFKFAPAATKFLETAFGSDNPLMFLAGFLMSFVVTMIFIRMIARGLEGVLKTANVNVLNQAAGGVLLSLVMVFLYSLLLWFGDISGLMDNVKEDSFTYEYLAVMPAQAGKVYEFLKPMIKDFWTGSVKAMDRIKEMGVEQQESDPNIFDINEDNDTPPAAKPASD